MQSPPYRPQTISQFLNAPTPIYHAPDTLNPPYTPSAGDLYGLPYPGLGVAPLERLRTTFHAFTSWLTRPARQG